MPRMLNLGNVLQLVDNAFHNGALCEHQTVIEQHQSLFHVAFELGDELNACGFEQLFGEPLRNVAFVREDFAEQLLQQLGNWSPVIGIAGSQDDVEEFSSVIDDEMQLEAKEPIN